MKEVWKDVPEYEGHYLVSNTGKVKSLKRNKEKFLNGALNEKGYMVFCLYREKNKRKFKLHQLVAMAFLNHKPCGMKSIIDHINNIKTDNTLNNLRIVSSRDNCYRVKNGLNTSEYAGVYKQNNKWRAQASIKNKRYHIGLFNDELQAHEAYKQFISDKLGV